MPNTTRVLLVDDDEAMLESMASILADEFVLVTCSSARAALSALASERFDVICLDWKMPEMDGLELYRSLEKQYGERMPGCILVTAHAAELLNEVSFDSRRALGMLRKPFSAAELIERVRLFANLARMRNSNAQLKAAVRGTG